MFNREERNMYFAKQKALEVQNFEKEVAQRVFHAFNNGYSDVHIFETTAFPNRKDSIFHAHWLFDSTPKKNLKSLISKLDPEGKFIDPCKSEINYLDWEKRTMVSGYSDYMFKIAFLE
jgi:hypothetical protein